MQAAAAFVLALDADGSGSIDRDELLEADTDGDGVVSMSKARRLEAIGEEGAAQTAPRQPPREGDTAADGGGLQDDNNGDDDDDYGDWQADNAASAREDALLQQLAAQDTALAVKDAENAELVAENARLRALLAAANAAGGAPPPAP